MISLDNALTPITRTEALTWSTETLQALGFDTESWQDGDFERTFLTLQATMASDFSDVQSLHAAWGFNRYAEGEALNLHSDSNYDQTKVPAVNTVGPVTFTNAGTQTYELKTGELIARSTSGILFTLDADDTIPASGSVPINMRANIAGITGNVPSDSITSLVTPLAGVTITNPGSPWYTTTGQDEESDASMRERNSLKWTSQTVELIAESYEAIARTAGASKVFVDDANPRGAGTIDVLCSAETALLSTPEMTAIQVAFSTRAFQTDSAFPPAASSRTAAVNPSTLALDVTATVYHDPNVPTPEMETRLRNSMLEFLRVTPLGGYQYLPDNDHVILRADVEDALRKTLGARTVILSLPSSTIAVGATELVIEGTWLLTAVAQQ